mmetsp:Transcript_5914/g.14092  ORF Transcript_5914/g.14092 Transcript_5914/m.14092 type:complete len:518 (+) Transcript_5914:412-1965(+)
MQPLHKGYPHPMVHWTYQRPRRSLTAPLLQQCYTQYIHNSQKRLDPARGELVEQHTLPYLQQQFQDQGAYICWSCASPILCTRLLSSKHATTRTEKITPHTSLDLTKPKDCALFLRHIFFASPNPLKHFIKQLLQTRNVPHLASLTREQYPCGLRNHPPIMLDDSLWVPFISTPPPEHPDFVVPGQIPGQWVIWMYSVQSQTHAPKTKYPQGKLTQIHPVSYELSRFRAFLQSDVDEAIESQNQPNSLLPSTSSTSASPVDPLIIPITFTNTNALLAYSLTREAVMKLRLAQAWTYDETKEHKVTINMALVRAIFFQKTTVTRLIFPLHTDTEHTEPTATQHAAYRMALNFLTEIALQAFRTNQKGEHPATAPATCQDDYSGGLKPKATNNKEPITLPSQKLPFSWPDLNPNKQRSSPNKQNQQPGPTNPVPDPQQSKKRPNNPHPWEHCYHCWTFGKHYPDQCLEPQQKSCPPDFKTKQKSLYKANSAAYDNFKRQKKATGNTSGGEQAQGQQTKP